MSILICFHLKFIKELQVLDTEFDKIIGTCNLVNTHKRQLIL